MVIQESGGVLDAIKHLDMYKENIFDKLTILEIYGMWQYFFIVFCILVTILQFELMLFFKFRFIIFTNERISISYFML